MRVALATCAALPELTPDDRLLLAELRRRGTDCRPAVWDDDTVEWAAFDAVVVRSAWDYHLRAEAFLDWASMVQAAAVTLWNPAALLRANAHKSYLRSLQAAGVPVLPTRWVDRGARVDLAALLDEETWPEVVLKPAVSASAHRTVRLTRAEAEGPAGRQALQDLLATGDVLVQPYAAEIGEQGEWSFVFLGARYSHAVLKRPAAGDYRVQEEWGGSAVALPPPIGLLEQARRIADRIPPPWLYARVDGIDRAGTLVLMELELIEPHLFLAEDPQAPGRLADAVLAAR